MQVPLKSVWPFSGDCTGVILVWKLNFWLFMTSAKNTECIIEWLHWKSIFLTNSFQIIALPTFWLPALIHSIKNLQHSFVDCQKRTSGKSQKRSIKVSIEFIGKLPWSSLSKMQDCILYVFELGFCSLEVFMIQRFSLWIKNFASICFIVLMGWRPLCKLIALTTKIFP